MLAIDPQQRASASDMLKHKLFFSDAKEAATMDSDGQYLQMQKSITPKTMATLKSSPLVKQ